MTTWLGGSRSHCCWLGRSIGTAEHDSSAGKAVAYVVPVNDPLPTFAIEVLSSSVARQVAKRVWQLSVPLLPLPTRWRLIQNGEEIRENSKSRTHAGHRPLASCRDGPRQLADRSGTRRWVTYVVVALRHTWSIDLSAPAFDALQLPDSGARADCQPLSHTYISVTHLPTLIGNSVFSRLLEISQTGSAIS